VIIGSAGVKPLPDLRSCLRLSVSMLVLKLDVRNFEARKPFDSQFVSGSSQIDLRMDGPPEDGHSTFRIILCPKREDCF
jgi:hypothetical protein